MKEITIHQAVDAIRAGKTVYVAKSAAKAFFLSEFMDSDKFFVEETAEEPNKEPKKTGPVAVKLAYDKIMEMRDAGETYDEIGAHFGCTGQTIRNFLAREGKAKSQKGE